MDPALLADAAGVTDIPVEIMAAAVEAERQAGELVREPDGGTAVALSEAAVSGRNRRRALAAATARGRPSAAAVPGRRRGRTRWVEQKMGLELAAAQRDAIRAGGAEQGAGRHRRPRRRQDHDRPRHPGNLLRPRACVAACAPDRPGGQAADRNDRPRGARPSTACWSSTRPWAASSATPPTRSTSICWSWTRRRWWTWC